MSEYTATSSRCSSATNFESRRQRGDAAVGDDQRALEALRGQVLGNELARARAEVNGRREGESLDAHRTVEPTLLSSVADSHEAKLEDVARPLRDADLGPHHPSQRTAIKREQRQVGTHQPQRVADKLAPARDVGFDADRIDQLIETGIRIPPAVERAGAIDAVAVHDRIQHRPGVGLRRPAELEKAGRRLRQLGKERRRRPGLERRPDADLRQHARDRLAHGRAVRRR